MIMEDRLDGNSKEDGGVDPLEAYMAQIEAEVKIIPHSKNNCIVPKADSLTEFPEDQYEYEYEYEDDDREPFDQEDEETTAEQLKNMSTEEIMALAQKKIDKRKEIGLVDHSSVSYRPFRKNFYVECPELQRMSDEEVRAYRAELDGIKVRGLRCPRPIRTWTQCGLDVRILEVIRRSGYTRPTPIQAQAIPAIMSGRDIIGIAKTGSGKTVAFLLPLLRHVRDQPRVASHEGPIALVLSPTRELAMQTFGECRRFATPLGLRVAGGWGGAPIKEQIANLKRGAEILVCTPGRLIDLLVANSGRVTNLRRVTFLVLDEADRMFDMGFGPQVLKVVDNIRPDRQAVLFSATFPATMEALARKILTKPLEIVVGSRSTVARDIEQVVEVMEEREKFLHLLDVLGRWYEVRSSRILIFVDRQDAADTLLRDLLRRGYHCTSLHGGKEQVDRDSAISDFRQGLVPILIATSVAARGLDVRDLRLVINYECPNHMEDYVHRVGRTGRAGNPGTAITFITPEQEEYAAGIAKALVASGTPVPPALQNLVDSHQAKVQSGLAARVGSGFGGKGLERIDREHEKQKRTQKVLLAPEEDVDSEEEEEILAKSLHVDKKVKIPEIKDTEALPAGKTAAPKVTASGTTRKISNATLPAEIEAALKKIQEKIGEEEIVDPLAAVNARYRIGGASSGEVVTLYDRPTGKDVAPAARAFYSEFEVNDVPQLVRFRITHKDNLTSISELSGALLVVRGEYIPPGKIPKEGQRRLYIRIDSNKEGAVEKALFELRRTLMDFIKEVNERGSLESAARYGL